MTRLTRFWLESALALASGLLFVLTLAWPDWIEAVLHVDPDGHSGATEWLVVAVLAATTVVAAIAARADWRAAEATD